MKQSAKILAALIAGALLLVLGALGGWWWASRVMVHTPTGDQAAMPQNERKVLYWYDPMVPQQRFDKPGKSPFMDMALVPKYADEASEVGGVRIDPSLTQRLGVRLAKVERVPLSSQVEATGIVGFNERDVAVVQSRSGGFVERVWPLAPGDVVRAGQPLVELLVPEWAAAQQELLAVRSAGDPSLLAAARDRLRLLGMPDALIHTVEQSGAPRPRYTVILPRGGLLQALEVREGMTVAAGQMLARVNGLVTVWLEASVPEAYAASVRIGGTAEARFPGSDQPVRGRVTAILPALNEATRSLRVRIELPNRDGRLRPGLSAQVRLITDLKESALAVPTEAVIRTGKRALVMVAGEQGRYMPVEVMLGREIGDRTVIASGLAEGQEIVASGQFLIDSEASLSGIMARSAGEAGSVAGRHATTKDSPALHPADARIDEIGKEDITLTHGPFKTLNMPGMSMTFPLARQGLTAGMKAGDQVTVFVRQSDDGLIVERLEKAGGKP